ncbi:MAG: hypothetical protein HQL39_15140 [Alphaproteobacteria bacterium]|nr:hypothetical protein [Alphaproteobacteria bacterium]
MSIIQPSAAFWASQAPAGGGPDPYGAYRVLAIRGNQTDGITDLTGRHTPALYGGASVTAFSGPFAAYTSVVRCIGSGGSRLAVPDSADFNVGSGDFTFQKWLFNDGTTGGQIVGQYNGVDANGCVFLYCDANAGGYYYAYTSSAGTGTAGSNWFVEQAWQHVALERQGTALRLYRGGVVKATVSLSPGQVLTDSTLELAFGSRSGGAALDLACYLCDIIVYKGVAIYGGSSYTPPTGPMSVV